MTDPEPIYWERSPIPSSSTPEDHSLPEVPAMATEAGSATKPGLPQRPVSSLLEHLPRALSFYVGIGIMGFFILAAAYGAWAFRGAGTFLTPNVNWEAAIYPPGPSLAHPFGISEVIGVDLYSAMLRATPLDVTLVGTIVVGGAVLGLLVGAASGMAAGIRGDLALTSFMDVFATIPAFFLVFVLYMPIRQFLPLSWYLPVFAVVFVLVLWPYHARPVRARARQIDTEGFVESARASGAGPWRILRHHVLPNALGPVLAQVPVDVMMVFFALTVFPFVTCLPRVPRGFFEETFSSPLPVPIPLVPEWGNLLATGVCFGWSVVPGNNFWWMYAFPAAAIILFCLGITLVADGLGRQASRASG
ncbi:MAG: ABC transporter permease subunit [Thermoplasmata archaeon]